MASPINQSPAYNRFYHSSHSSSPNHQGTSPTSRKSYDYLFKILLCGDSGVGKTNMIARYCEGIYSSLYVSTIGVDFKIKTVEWEGRVVKLQIWDPAGQERFGNLVRAYFRGANAVMFVYDITRKETFDHIRNWRQCVESELGPIYSTIPKMLVGNKLDREKDRQVHFAEASDYAEFAHMRFIETSVLKDDNVNIAFSFLVQDLVLQKEHETEHGIITIDSSCGCGNNQPSFTLSRKENGKKSGASCSGIGNRDMGYSGGGDGEMKNRCLV